jgi:hydrogenase maturation protease
MKTLVLGVGNTLLADEGAGVYAMQFLKEQYDLPDTEFLDGGTLSFTLTGAIAEATNLIIFDAAQMDGDPGYVRVFEGAEFQDFLMSGCHSVHEVGFADLIDITRLMDSLGEAVREAIPKAAACGAELIRKWQGETPARVVLQ